MRSIDEIVKDWKAEYGVLKTGRNSQYVAIEFKERKTLLLSLAQTMIDEGYEKESITSTQTYLLVLNACTPSGDSAVPAKSLKTWKKMVTDDWKDYVCPKLFRGNVSKYVDKKAKEEPKVEDISSVVVSEEEMIKMANLHLKLKSDPNLISLNLSEDKDEEDTEFLEFMGLQDQNGATK